MAGLMTVGNILAAASTVAGVGQTIAQANQLKIGSKRQAEQLQIQKAQTEKQAKQEMAIATHEAAQHRKKAEQVKSRATALAAKSGAAGFDPFEIDAEGDYRVLTALHNGEVRADTLRGRASQLELQSAAASRRSIYDRYGTYARGVSTFADRAETLHSNYG